MEPFVIGSAVLALALAYVAFPVALHVYRRIRGPRFVICPETGGSAEVELGAARAALGAAAGKQWLRVARCGRWPGKQACDQGCLRGIDSGFAESHWLLVPNEARRRPQA